MKAEDQRRIRELVQLLKDLRMPHPPLERSRLAARLWRLVSSLPDSEQKRLLRHLGLANLPQLLGPLAMGRGTALPTPFLEFVEEGIKFLPPGRISSLLESLATQISAADEPPPAGPGAPADAGGEEDVRLPQEDEPIAEQRPLGPPPPLEDPGPEKVSLAGPEGSAEGDDGPVEEEGSGDERLEVGSESSKPEGDRRPFLPPDTDAAEVCGEAELERGPSRPTGEGWPGRSPRPGPIERLVARSDHLAEAWRRRRFWLDVARRGFEPEESESILRAVAAAKLPAQDYVWVVDEMAVRGLLPERLISTALELAPSESAARLLERRLPALVEDPVPPSRESVAKC